MNCLLGFRERETERRYYNKLDEHLQLAQSLLLLNLVLKEILFQSLFAIIELEEYLSHLWALVTRAVLNLVALILVFLIKRKTRNTKAAGCRPNFKYVTWVTDIALLGCAFTVIQNHIQVHDSHNLSILDGWIQFFQIFYYSFLIFNWFSRALLFVVFLVIAGINWKYFQDNDENFDILSISLNVVMAFVIYYSVEKSNRKRFLERNALLEKSEAWKKMINEFPDGMMLMDQQGKLLFCNKALEQLVLRQELPLICRNSESKCIELTNLDCFQKISVAFCDERVKQLRDSVTGHIEIPIARASTNLLSPNRSQRDTLVTFLTSLLINLDIFSHKKSDSFLASLPNDQQLVLLDSQLIEEEDADLSHGSNRVKINTDQASKSFQIKIWLTLFEGQRVFALLFSETTQMKLVHQLQDRDAYRSRLLASVSHELRTPLNGSLNFMSRVAEDSTISPDIKEKYVIPAIRSSTLLLNLINDILDFSQLQVNKLRLTFEMGNIIESIHECLKLFEIQAKMKGISLVLDYSKATSQGRFDPLFCTDHKRFKQILLNLLSNAIKFSQLQGVVKVLVSEVRKNKGDSDHDDHHPLSASSGSEDEKRFLKIEVEDQGIGIPKEDQKKLFTEFTHIENYDRISVNPNGVGLGLMISNLLAIQLGEKPEQVSNQQGLKVASEEGKGTAFSFILEDKRHNSKKNVNDPRIQIQDQTQSPDEETKKDAFGQINTPIYRLILAQDSSWGISEKVERDSLSLLSVPLEKISLSELSVSHSPGSHFRAARLIKTQENNFSQLALQVSQCLCPEILVVDDDSFNIMAIESILQSINLNNHRAFNGKEGIQKALHRAQNPCSKECCYYKMILMDCTMPVMNGFEAARKLKEFMKEGKIPATTIIACTALAQTSDIQEALAAGMDDYCIKPLSKDKIRGIIQKFL